MVATAHSEESIEGALDQVVFANEENGWCVVRLNVRGRGQVTAVGNLVGVQPGESLRLKGRWVTDRKYGQQFQVQSFLSIRPSTFLGIERYLGSGLIAGIGPALAKRLVQHFGLQTLEVIDRQPQRLGEVEGIGPVRRQRIAEAFQQQRHVQEVMVFLQSHGISSTFAARIYQRYGQEAMAKVRDNPYRLAQDVRGIGFAGADRIARDLGIPQDSPRRAEAGLRYTLQRAAGRGHMFLQEPELLSETTELLGLTEQPVSDAIQRELEQEELQAEALPDKAGRAIFLPKHADAEAGLAQRLLELLQQPSNAPNIDIPRALTWFEARAELRLANEQRRALARALEAKVLVITGGPGTGKTTLVRGIVRILTKKSLRVALAAPTGRAAKRLAEASGIEAKTIHRLLEYNPQTRAFTRDREQPLQADLVVVDESSMLDTDLAWSLVQAVPDRGRLVLVGDADQLPSVGPGRVLGDLIDSGAVEVVRLEEIYRQAASSRIVTNAHRVRRGQQPHTQPEEGSDFFFFEREEPDQLLATVRHLVTERIPKGFGFDPMLEIQVLTPMQRGLLGAANLNAELQALLNPDGSSVTRGGRLFRVGDRVMQLRNNYDLRIFNGDVGRILSLDKEEQLARVELEDCTVSLPFADLDDLGLAYACSIHKSQGSEYPCIVVPLHTQHFMLLQRNLVYTAITRGRKLVVLVGSRRALEMAVDNQTSHQRNTLLSQRLAAQVQAEQAVPIAQH